MAISQIEAVDITYRNGLNQHSARILKAGTIGINWMQPLSVIPICYDAYSLENISTSDGESVSYGYLLFALSFHYYSLAFIIGHCRAHYMNIDWVALECSAEHATLESMWQLLPFHTYKKFEGIMLIHVNTPCRCVVFHFVRLSPCAEFLP